jgi:hypothetical protein
MFAQTGRLTRTGLVTLLCFACVVGDATAQDQQEVQPGELPLGRATTFITEPLQEDGTPDYVAWLNRESSRGVTPENNAAVPIVRVFGRGFFPKRTQAESLRRLGIEGPLPAESLYKRAWDSVGKPFREETFEAIQRRPWTAQQHPRFARWVRQNEQALRLLEKASRRPRLHLPLVCEGDPPQVHKVMLPALGRIRGLGRAMAARAMLRAGEGDPEAAWKDAMTLMRFGRLLQEQQVLIGWLVGLSLEMSGSRAAAAVATECDLSTPRARAFLADLRALPAQRPAVEVANHGERFGTLGIVLMVYQGPVAEGESEVGFNMPREMHRVVRDATYWGEVLRPVNTWWDKQVAAMSKRNYRFLRQCLEEYEREFRDMSEQHGFSGSQNNLDAVFQRWGMLAAAGEVTPEFSRHLGRCFTAWLLPDIGRASTHQYTALARRRLVEMALALAAYEAEMGSYPVLPVLLKPRYIDELPLDPFDDEPFKYQRRGQGFVLYSVGPDMDDDGGRDEGDDEDDIAVRVPAAGGG